MFSSFFQRIKASALVICIEEKGLMHNLSLVFSKAMKMSIGMIPEFQLVLICIFRTPSLVWQDLNCILLQLPTRTFLWDSLHWGKAAKIWFISWCCRSTKRTWRKSCPLKVYEIIYLSWKWSIWDEIFGVFRSQIEVGSYLFLHVPLQLASFQKQIDSIRPLNYYHKYLKSWLPFLLIFMPSIHLQQCLGIVWHMLLVYCFSCLSFRALNFQNLIQITEQKLHHSHSL